MSHLKARSVLVVEDEWLVRMEVAQAFEDEGGTVLEAGSAEGGMEILANIPAVELLVTDIRLSGTMTGWELAREARRIKPELAVIYLSANPPAPDLHVQGSRFIGKPALMRDVIGVAVDLLQ